MENSTVNNTTKTWALPNRTIYGLMVAAGIVYLLLKKDWSMASVMMGLALAWDPFDPKQPWNYRPVWQKVWLMAHLVATFTLLVMAIFIKK